MKRVGERVGVLRASVAVAVLLALAPPAAAQGGSEPATPAEMVATYSALADSILAAKRAEANLIRSVLAAANAHGQVQLARAQRAIAAGDTKGAQTSLEALAADVGQIGTEGDAAVAAVRKRLVEGGHHHNAAGESQGIYDEGFVVVTRTAKQKLLEASRAIGQLARAPKAEALEVEWKKVQTVYADLMKPTR